MLESTVDNDVQRIFGIIIDKYFASIPLHKISIIKASTSKGY